MRVIIITLPRNEYVIWIPGKGGYLLNHPTKVALEIKQAWVMDGDQVEKVILGRGLLPIVDLGYSAHG